MLTPVDPWAPLLRPWSQRLSAHVNDGVSGQPTPMMGADSAPPAGIPPLKLLSGLPVRLRVRHGRALAQDASCVSPNQDLLLPLARHEGWFRAREEARQDRRPGRRPTSRYIGRRLWSSPGELTLAELNPFFPPTQLLAHCLQVVIANMFPKDFTPEAHVACDKFLANVALALSEKYR
uniref:Uncharacterized protein n=1 Tax=Oryzias latipes TaxID=8090 RepID=A0A3B3HH82_ORYLA